VVCSEIAKEMLLKAERTKDRINYDNGLTKHKCRPFSHLKVGPNSIARKQSCSFTRDLLVRSRISTAARTLTCVKKAIPLNKPTEFELSASLKVRVTAIDANHCPGAVM